MNDFEMWFGSELSFKQAQISLAQVQQDPRLDAGEDFNPTEYGLLSVSDGVGVINIQGSMVTNAPLWASFFGVIGYNTIKDTLTYAAQDPEIKSILLNIDSGGGSAVGIDSVATLINKISSDYKPVTAFSEGSMCSAAYWIGASTDAVYATRLATLGSVGVIAVSQEFTGMMEQEGIKATVFRAGEFKALGSPYEKMDEKAAAEIQSKLDMLYTEFTTNIANERGLSLSTAEASWAEGRTFAGFQALDVGLVDEIVSFEDLVTNLKKKCEQTSSSRMNLSTEGEPDMARRKLLSEQSAALLAMGVPVEAALDAATEEPEQTEVPVEEAPAQEAPEAEAKVVPPANEEMASYFKTQLADAQEKIINLSVENKEMKTKLETMDVTHTQLRAIAMDSINLRSVGLGRGHIDLSTASDEVILSTFSTISKTFNNTFPVGGVTEVASTEKEVGGGQTMQQRRAVGATRI